MIEGCCYCPCCGHPGLCEPAYEHLGPPPWGNLGTPPYGPRLGIPSFAVCDCCGFQFGYDDDPGAGPGVSFARYLNDWAAGGGTWFYPGKRPVGWSLTDQLRVADIGLPDRLRRFADPPLG
jgi:hypothetical protein